MTAHAGVAVPSGPSDAGTAPLIRIEHPAAGVALIVLARPASRNSLSLAMIAALREAVATLGAAPDVRAIVLAADGPAFCAGHDLKELTARRADADGGKAFYSQTMQACAALMLSIVTCPKPVIAAVHAMATAAGCQLVASCDLAIAGSQAKFCTPGVNIGLFCSTPMVALSRNVPRKRAMEMLLLGEVITASQAAEYGLVNRALAETEPLAAALEMASVIASKSPATVAIGKEAFYRQLEMGLSDAYDYAAHVMVENMMHRDAVEGIGAFIEKRPPLWSGC
ncbi:MAG: enoyl-CoA hydratase [Hyphomicrobiaceae bacterium]|nr:enoyl-CoA hydratase [Hyphomicrobiaceae bacterium]